MPVERRDTSVKPVEKKDTSGKPVNSTDGSGRGKPSWTSRFRRKSEEHQQEKKVSMTGLAVVVCGN